MVSQRKPPKTRPGPTISTHFKQLLTLAHARLQWWMVDHYNSRTQKAVSSGDIGKGINFSIKSEKAKRKAAVLNRIVQRQLGKDTTSPYPERIDAFKEDRRLREESRQARKRAKLNF